MRNAYLAVFAISLLIVSAVAFADSFVYDDFSGSELNTSKWTEWCPEAGCLEYHNVNLTEERYHWMQTFYSALKNVNVNMSGYNFSSGDIVDFDFYYVNGTGNGVAYVGVRNQTGGVVGLTEIGYWNADKEDGNIRGEYHYRIEFFDTYVNLTLTRPDGVINRTVYIDSPAILGFSANVGHNGLYHWDWDNFTITTPEPPTTTTTTTTSTTTSTTTTTTSSTTTTIPADADNDGVADANDKCPGTAGEQIAYGCSCEQILELKPGKSNGLLKHGCSNGIINVFTKLIGWARNLF